MKILIATGIYPPDPGGPANYAKQLNDELSKLGHITTVATYRLEKKLPTGIRHLWFMGKIIPRVLRAELIIFLDPFSVGLPGFIIGRLFRKKMILRTGGDFVWEQYIERTRKKVLLKEFYNPVPADLSAKEKFLMWWIGVFLRGIDRVIFSTEFQRDIFMEGYHLDRDKTDIIENYYGEKRKNNAGEPEMVHGKKVFLWAGRKIVFKNIPLLEEAFAQAQAKNSAIELEISEQIPREELLGKIKNSYAVIYPSLTEISPNFILEALMLEKPFICTRDVGFYDRIKEVGVFVDPKSVEDVSEKILYLADEENYHAKKKEMETFDYVRTYADIAKDFESVIETIK